MMALLSFTPCTLSPSHSEGVKILTWSVGQSHSLPHTHPPTLGSVFSVIGGQLLLSSLPLPQPSWPCCCLNVHTLSLCLYSNVTFCLTSYFPISCSVFFTKYLSSSNIVCHLHFYYIINLFSICSYWNLSSMRVGIFYLRSLMYSKCPEQCQLVANI